MVALLTVAMAFAALIATRRVLPVADRIASSRVQEPAEGSAHR